MTLLQVCLWLCSGHGEIGCATVITNLAKVLRKQTEQEKLEWSEDNSLQLPPALICSGNFPQTHRFHASDWISMHPWWDGKKKERQQTLALKLIGKQMFCQCRVISALVSFKWNLYACLGLCSAFTHLSYAPHLQFLLDIFTSPCMWLTQLPFPTAIIWL